LPQSVVLRSAELEFSGIAKDLCDRTPLALLDSVIEIFKGPVQPLPKSSADAGLASAHEAHQKHGSYRRCRAFSSLKPHTRAGFGSRTLAGTLQFLLFLVISQGVF